MLLAVLIREVSTVKVLGDIRACATCSIMHDGLSASQACTRNSMQYARPYFQLYFHVLASFRRHMVSTQSKSWPSPCPAH